MQLYQNGTKFERKEFAHRNLVNARFNKFNIPRPVNNHRSYDRYEAFLKSKGNCFMTFC